MKMQINPQNWVDTELTITINESKKTMRMYDNTFTFKVNKETDEVEVYGDEWPDDYVLCTGEELEGEWFFESTGIERSDKNMYCAAAKVLANII